MAVLVDMGFEVLDGSTVETCLYTLAPNRLHDSCRVFDLRSFRSSYREALLSCFRANATSRPPVRDVFLSRFRTVPRSRVLHWLPDRFLEMLEQRDRLDPLGGTAKNGLQTYGDERFLRLVWEVPAANVGRDKKWIRIAKGGDYETFYYPTNLVMNYDADGKECGAVNYQGNGQIAQTRRNSEFYYLPAATYPSKSTRGFSVRQLPRDSLFALKGPAIVGAASVSAVYLLGWANSNLVRGLVVSQASTGEYLAGILQQLPWCEPTSTQCEKVRRLARQITENKRVVYSRDETDPSFVCCWEHSPTPSSISAASKLLIKQVERSDTENATLLLELNRMIEEVYGITTIDPVEWDLREDDHALQRGQADFSLEKVGVTTASFLLGCVMGRWDLRHIVDSRRPSIGDLWDPAPACSPGSLTSESGAPLTRPPESYPITVAKHGIVVNDPGHREDLIRRIDDVIAAIWPENSEAIHIELAAAIDSRSADLRQWFQKHFFDSHLDQYSQSRRKAPIYLPLATRSGEYTLWVYYPRLNDQTLHIAVNQFVNTKMDEVERSIISNERDTRDGSGRAAAKTADRIAEAQAFLSELSDLREELLRVAALPYKPNLNDGVIINAAPLHRLFRHRQWSQNTEAVWKKLEKGEYDWSHMAYTIWPDRVKNVCKKDLSIAIAHGLEELYNGPKPGEKKKRKTRKKAKTEAAS